MRDQNQSSNTIAAYAEAFYCTKKQHRSIEDHFKSDLMHLEFFFSLQIFPVACGTISNASKRMEHLKL
jgi:hypothetical protein